MTKNLIQPSGSIARIFHSIGNLPTPLSAPEDGGAGGAAAQAGERPGSDLPEPGSLISQDQGSPDNEGQQKENNTPDDQAGTDGAENEDQSDPLDAIPDDGKYDFSSLDLPDGMEIDQDLADMAGPRFAEANLSHKQANEVAKIFTDLRKQQSEDWQKTNQDWQGAVKSDKEIGGDNLQGSLAASEKFIDQFGTKELRDYLVSSGGGNHPEIIRAFARAGKALAEDNPDGKASAGTPDTASVLYPND